MSRALLPLLGAMIWAAPASAQEGYYAPGKAALEFREVVEDGQDADPAKTETLKDDKGNSVRLIKCQLLSTVDIEGIQIEKDNRDLFPVKDNKDVVPLKVCLYFKRSSWLKVETETKRLLGKKLAVIYNGQVLLAPAVHVALRDVAELSGADIEKYVPRLAADMQPAKGPPTPLERKKARRTWLEEQLAAPPRNPGWTLELARLYYSTEEYEKAAPLFKELWLANPSAPEAPRMLGMCHMGKQQYEEALRCCEKLLSDNPAEEHTTRFLMALVHHAKGDKAAALREMDKALKALESSGLKGDKKADALRMIEDGRTQIQSP
jgi:tetratricopeptide (TPR) repeat protein